MANTIIYHRCLASSHYPPVRFEEGRRVLWNKLTAKTAAYRPEESVRLQYVDYLTLQIGFSHNHIMTESPVPGRLGRGRTDILCYSKQYEPFLLVECKSEKARIGQAAANQSGVYNRIIKAPYILLTNGIQDAFFNVTDKLTPLDVDAFPPPFQGKAFYVNYDGDYWINRGFIHKTMPEDTAAWLTTYTALLFQASDLTRGYLHAVFPMDEMPLNHHYVFLTSDRHPDALYAVSFVALSEDSTWFVAICNRRGINLGCLRVRVDEDASFDYPELLFAKHIDPITPDISALEEIFFQEEVTCMDASGLFERDEAKLSIKEADTVARRITRALDPLFFDSE